MTERKPPGMSWETWIDRQIREASDRGEFDNLPGAGKPIPGLDGHRDENWWLRGLVAREKIELLPPALQLRKDLDDALERIKTAATEADVREIIGDINGRIRALNRKAIDGPPSSLVPLDIERVAVSWRAARGPTLS